VPRSDVVAVWASKAALIEIENPTNKKSSREPKRMDVPPPTGYVLFEQFSQEI